MHVREILATQQHFSSIFDHFISCKAELHFCNRVDNTVSLYTCKHNIIHPSAAKVTEQQVVKHKAYNIE